MISIPRPRPGGSARGDPPRSVVHDLETDRVGFGPEGQLDGVARGWREVGVFDAVAHSLVHGEHQVLFGLFGQVQWSQPTADLSANRRQLMGIRRPRQMNKFSQFAYFGRICFAHFRSPAHRAVSISLRKSAAGVQSKLRNLCWDRTRCVLPPKREAAGHPIAVKTETGGTGPGCEGASPGPAPHPDRALVSDRYTVERSTGGTNPPRRTAPRTGTCRSVGRPGRGPGSGAPTPDPGPRSRRRSPPRTRTARSRRAHPAAPRPSRPAPAPHPAAHTSARSRRRGPALAGRTPSGPTPSAGTSPNRARVATTCPTTSPSPTATRERPGSQPASARSASTNAASAGSPPPNAARWTARIASASAGPSGRTLRTLIGPPAPRPGPPGARRTGSRPGTCPPASGSRAPRRRRTRPPRPPRTARASGAAGRVQHPGRQVGLQAAERLAGQDVQPHGDQRARRRVEDPVRCRRCGCRRSPR